MLAAAAAVTHCTVIAPGIATAQSFRYEDEAGNLYWADRLDQVPAQYRSQIVALPTPISDPKVLKKKMKEVKKAQAAKKKKQKKQAKVKKIPKAKKGTARKEEIETPPPAYQPPAPLKLPGAAPPETAVEEPAAVQRPKD